MPQETAVTAIAHVIQLAVAPVFLLTGIGATLAVMTNRLSRIVDRARELEARATTNTVEAESVDRELRTLSRRARIVSFSIGLCTTTALLVSAVIAILFLGVFFEVDMSVPVVLLFVAAMVAFFTGLLLFLREIFIATAGLRFGHRTLGR